MSRTEPSAPLLQIHDYLAGEGFRPSLEEGEVAFKFQGRRFFISHEDSDAEFYRLLYPHFWKIESGDEMQAVLEAASETCKTLKVAKAFVVGEEVWASVELFCPSVEVFLGLFERSTSLLYETANLFRHHYNRLLHGPETDDAEEMSGGGHDHDHDHDHGHDHDEEEEDPSRKDSKKEEPHH